MSFSKTVNLGNSIIGVSILAMPYCFVQSGVLLSIILIIFSGFLTRLSCHLLLKSAFLSRQTSFELMVQDVLGTTGRFLVEIGLIGFLLGTCVAYFIMIGDLAPKILAELMNIQYDNNLRIITVILLSLTVALPLSLLKRVDSLTSLSVLSMVLYSCLVVKLVFESSDEIKLLGLETIHVDGISYWNTSGLLTTFPIFSMAMSCQTSLFEIFDKSVVNCDLETLKRDNKIIKKAIYMCSVVYIIVGLLGYTAFHHQTLYGNILLAFPPSFTTTLTKFGFTISLLLSFPLCLFPCRTSVHSLTLGKMNELINMQKLENTSIHNVRVDGSVDIIVDEAEDSSKLLNEQDIINNNGDKTGRKYQNLILPVYAPQRFSTVVDNHGSSYAYTKLLSDNDEFMLNQTNSNNIMSANESDTRRSGKARMSDAQFQILTVILIIVTVLLSLLFPNIEFTLGIIGSTAGTTVCFILPAYTFIKIGKHSRIELYSARLLLLIGLAMFVFCTYSTVHKANLSVANN